MEKAELLAPAGSPEGLRAAIAAGADAVYLGASSFSARASAGFDEKALHDAIALAHLHGRRVYVAVNTLVKQREWPQLMDLLAELGKLRPDAVLVQDLGVLSQIKKTLPGLQVHASTQMAVHNAAGARLLLDAGISRVVAARECSLDDIRGMVQTGIEVEVFVHGALCVSVSGQCLLSSQIGGRSGNRGRCAQPCRLPYRYLDQEGALLSMRDLNTLEGLPRLLSAGVCSFKIEGRLKRPEYITEVVGIYRRALDLARDNLALNPSSQYQERLAQVFNRGGFTSGHLFNEEDRALIGQDRVSHEGVLIGSIRKSRRMGEVVLAECGLDKVLHNGDGLQIRGQADQEIIYSGPEVPAGQTAILRLRHWPRAGDAVYRLADEAQLSRARAQATIDPPIPFDVQLTLTSGQPARLKLMSGKAQATVAGDIPLPARSQPLNEETASAYLGKTGGTPFELEKTQVISDAALFLPAASLNQLRREGLNALEAAITQGHQRPEARPWALAKADFAVGGHHGPRLYAMARSLEVYQALKPAGIARLIYSPTDFRAGRLEMALEQLNQQDIVALPPQMRDKPLEDAFNLINKAGHTLMLTNVSHLALDHRRPFIAGEGIPVWNDKAAGVVKDLGAQGICLSRELSQAEAADLDGSLAEWIVPVYGRASVMLLSHCPERVRRGLSANRAACRMCDRGQGVRGKTLEDRFQAAYPLLPIHFPEGCLITLCHHTPLNLLDRAPGNLSWLMDFTDESPEEALRIAQSYHALREGGILPSGEPDFGRFLDGVL